MKIFIPDDAAKRFDSSAKLYPGLEAFRSLIQLDHLRTVTWSPVHNSAFNFSYKVNSFAELKTLIKHYPPTTLKALRGSYTMVCPPTTDVAYERLISNAKAVTDCYGVYLRVENSHVTGQYPCDQDEVIAVWFTDTPAGRLYIRVIFHWLGERDETCALPYIQMNYAAGIDRRKHDDKFNRRIASTSLMQCPAGGHVFQYSSGDNYIPSNFLIYFPKASSFNAFVKKQLAKTPAI